jgi:hypothetical protein
MRQQLWLIGLARSVFHRHLMGWVCTEMLEKVNGISSRT